MPFTSHWWDLWRVLPHTRLHPSIWMLLVLQQTLNIKDVYFWQVWVISWCQHTGIHSNRHAVWGRITLMCCSSKTWILAPIKMYVLHTIKLIIMIITIHCYVWQIKWMNYIHYHTCQQTFSVTFEEHLMRDISVLFLKASPQAQSMEAALLCILPLLRIISACRAR